MKSYLYAIILLSVGFSFAQQNPSTSVLIQQNDAEAVELTELRSEFSKTFQLSNKLKTKQVSSSPIHFQNDNGTWEEIDYSIQTRGNQWTYPSHDPIHVFDANAATIQLKKNGNSLLIGNPSFLFVDEDFQKIDEINFSASSVTKESETISITNNEFDIEVQHQLYDFFRKTNYVLNDKNILPSNASFLVVKNKVQLPQDWRIEVIGEESSHIKISDSYGKKQFFVGSTVLTDARDFSAKERSLYQPNVATYEINHTSEGTEIHTLIPMEWLLDEDVVFPLYIDPVVGIENDEVFGSCFFPNFLESQLSLEVPEGETVLWSNIEYDYVATSNTQAWMSDQISYVSSHNGETNQQGSNINTAGTSTFVIHTSQIANGVSTGEVSFTFHTSRDWGGFGCNTVFQIINRRKVEVVYGDLVFGEGPVIINEYSIANRGNITGAHTGQSFNDNFNRTENWIELYNTDTENFFDLTGYYLSNDIENPTMWQISDGVIPPGSKVMVYGSRRDISSGVVLHANFNLRQLRPDDIVFANPEGEILESYTIEKTQVNHSRGRVTDGAEEWGLFTLPTPGQPNEGAFSSYTSKPIIEVEAGVYESPITVSILTENEDEIIRYTLDGSTPTETSSIYESPILISETSVLRARCFSDEESIIPGFIETNSYIIGEDHTLPIFSFSGDSDMLSLFNGNDNLRPLGHFEYFDENGEFIDENFGDFNKHGNDSWQYAQRGVDFISRDEFGYNRRLEHKFFATSDRTRFRRLMVKAAANDNYPFQQGGAHIRDSYIQTLSQLAKLDLDERSSTNVALYVNGQYWGIYDLRERVDDNNFTDYYYNQDYTFSESDIYLQFLKTWGSTQAHFGNQSAIQDWSNLVSFVQNNSMADESNLSQVEETLNMQSFIDHFILNSYVVSRDWLNYNTGWWRGLDPNGDAQKWRYIVWDMEAALGHFINYTGLPDASANANPCQVENITVGNGHAQILKKMIDENPQVKERYVNRYIDLMNTHFKYENAVAVLDSMVNNIAPEMPKQIERWGGSIDEWQDNVQDIRDFLQTRSDALVSGLMSCYDLTGPYPTEINVIPATGGKVKLNNEELSEFPFEATLFGEINTYLTAIPNPGYSFAFWVADGVIINPDETEEQISFMLSEAATINAYFVNENLGDDTLIHYWHFNTLDTPEDIISVESDFSVDGMNALITYAGSGNRDMDAFNTGSELNLYFGEAEGTALRVRNNSQNRSLVFDLNSTGYKDLIFSYAVQRSGQGMLQNILTYSIDGTNFISDGLTTNSFTITEDYQLVEIDFSSISGVNNNENFKIKIEFEGNTNQNNGNNRYDNISLKGQPFTLGANDFEKVAFQVYPNPFVDYIRVQSTESVQSYKLVDLKGRLIRQNKINNEVNFKIQDLNSLPNGMYLLQIETSTNTQSFKVIK